MNTYNFNDPIFRESQVYKKFMDENPGVGYLRVRAYAASQALPVSGLRVIISKIIDDNKVIFYDGVTNNSGVVERIILPVPRLNTDNQVVPLTMVYDIQAIYEPDNIERKYHVNMYENVYAVQNINIVPNINSGIGGF